VAVPNVTAIDCEQADVYGQKASSVGGMSFTVQEARAAFFSCCYSKPYPHHVGGPETYKRKIAC